MEKIKIALASHSIFFNDLFANSLRQELTAEVTAMCTSLEELLKFVESNEPSLIILDTAICKNQEILIDFFLERIKDLSGTKVMLSGRDIDQTVFDKFLVTGLKGCFTYNCDLTTILKAVQQVCNGFYFFCQYSNKHLVARVQETNPTSTTESITKKEQETLALICEDKVTKEIAHVMKISERTVERYKTNLYTKTKSKSVAGLVLFAVKNNLFS